MKNLLKQFGSLIGAGVAAACCLGVPLVLSTLGAVGLGFIVHDAYLLPLFVGFIALSLWSLYRSAVRYTRLQPFWLALVGGIEASVALWLLVTGTYPHSWPMYVGLVLLVSGSVWDLINARRAPACKTTCATEPVRALDVKRRAATGAALSVAAAGAFFALYKSVDVMTPAATAGDIACWGINSCKGQTACSTALNACKSQNTCKGRGYLNVSAQQCKARGGQPLQGSPADPARG
ncbi:MAG TPA: MerC domain-containing protein [Candidatus Binataceae bacterium]|nr:MerC domain-containing protein [Candidatus Binataceae bacterium]